MSSLDRIRQAFPELANASDSEVLGEVARRTGAPADQIAETLGVKPRGTLAEIARQGAAGLVVDAPEMLGQALKYYSEPGGTRVNEGPFQRLGKASGLEQHYGVELTEQAPAYAFGQSLVDAAQARAPAWAPDMRGRGLVGQAFTSGARGVGAMVPTLAAMAIPGGQAVAPMLQAALFGGSSAQDTYEKLISQGVSEEDATAAARKVWVAQGLGEGIATAGLGAAVRPALAAARGAPTTARVAAAATDAGVLRPFATGLLANTALQAGTEAAQDVSTSLIERAYGAAPEDLGAIAGQSALAGAGMSLLLGPLALGGAISRARRAESLKQALYNPDTPAETRAKAMDLVMGEARRQGVPEQDVGAWVDQQLAAEDARTEALRATEQQAEMERRTAAIDLTGGQAQQLAGLQGGMFSSLEQQRTFEQGAAGVQFPSTFVSPEQQRAAQLGYETMRDRRIASIGQQYQDLMGGQASTLMQAQDIGQQAQPMLAPYQRGRESAQQAGEQWQELRAQQTRTAMDIDAMGQEWQKLQAELPQPVTGALTGAQKAALRGPAGKRLKKTSEPIAPVAGGPMATSLLQLPQAAVSQLPQAAPAPVSQLTERPVVSPPSGAPAVPTPAAPVVAGGSLPAAPAAPAKPRGKKTTIPAATKRAAPKPRRGAKTTPTAKAPVVELDTDVAEQDTQAAQAAIDELGLKPLAEGGQKNLQASVQGGKITVSGKASIGARALTAARNAFLGVQKTERKPTSEGGKLAAAAKTFGSAYMKYLNAAGNVVPTERKDKQGNVIPLKPMRGSTARGDEAVAAERAGKSVGNVQAALQEAQAALATLGEAAGNNAKNVETLIRVTKDEIGRRKAALQAELDSALEDPASSEEDIQDTVDEIARLEQLDQGLSAGWAAAKRGVFRLDVDKLDVRSGEVRTSKEEQQQGAEQPLERAAIYGAAVGPRAKQETGFQGVLNYIRSRGTPFERMIAKGVTEVFRNTKNPPKLEFTDDGRNEYDPNTNTVYMSRTASPEIALHEALHAALQWFVHNNPKNPMVVQLLKAVDKVVTYDTTKLSDKAAAVQKILADLKKGKRDLDAVLELISYGNTLVEFRKALEAMPTKGEPTSFVQAAKDVWNMILATVRKMLNVPQSVASDVIMDSFKLLEEASRAEYKPAPGQVLQAAAQTTKPLSDAKIAGALGVSEQDYSRWAGDNLINILPTQRLFESVGWSEANAKKMVGAAGKKLADVINKNFPRVEIALGLINSRYNVSSSVSQIMDRFKLNKGIGYQYAEDLANVISRRSAEDVNALFAYLDGDSKALDALPDAAKLKAVADKLKQWFDTYVAELSAVEQRYFKSRKFTETLLFPERTEQVAGGTFGLGKINEVLGLSRKAETELDQNWFTKDANGDLLLDGDMYQVFKVDNTAKPGQPEAAGFMSAARFAELNGQNPMGYSVDTTRKWLHEGASDQGHSFITNTTARDKVANQKADDVANALRNTVAALANNYASKHFIKSVFDMGRGDSAHAQVAFDSLEDVNKEFGTTITEDKVLKASYEMSRSPQTKDLYRRTGTWVKLPDSKVYGELANKYVPGPVWNAMIDMSDRQPLVNVRAINNTMRWFKKSKTIWNPGTHVTNAASNVTLAMLHDISFGTMRDAAKLLAKYEAAPKSLTPAELQLVLAFRDSGAMLADYSAAEVKEALYKAHADNLNAGEDVSVSRRVAGWLGIEKSKAEWLKAQAAKAGKGADYIDDLASQLYAAEDNVFRLAAFLKTVGTLQAQAGLDKPTAEMLQSGGMFARKAFGDYDIDSKAVKVARQTVMPFISWFYAMAPVLGRIAVYQPWKFANVLAAYMLLEGAMGAMGGDDEEARANGPESVRERMFFGTIGPYMHVRVPFMGDDENPVYYKLGDYFPMASMTKGLPNGFMGQSWFPGGLTPSGPFVSGIAGLVLGVDPYTGKSIHQPTDTDWDKLWNATKFGYDIVTPPAVSSRNIRSVDALIEGKTGITGVEPSSLVLARMFGLKLYDFNVDEQAAINEVVIKRITRDFKAAMTKAKRDEMRKGYPDFEALDAELDALRERMEKEIEKAQGGAEEQ